MARTRKPKSHLVAWLVLLLIATGAVGPRAEGQAASGYSEYYIPANEGTNTGTSTQLGLFYILDNLDDAPNPEPSNMTSVIAVTAWAANTTIYYDHWEDGLDFDPNNPATADETVTLATAGAQSVFQSTSFTIPRSTVATCSPVGTCVYDGGDRLFVAGGTVTVTRAGWIAAVGAGDQAVAWEIYPVKPQLTTYVLPFGENLGTNPFNRVYALIQATADNTSFQVDLDANGTFDLLNANRNATKSLADGDSDTVTLNAGQTFLLDRISACTSGVTCTTFPGGGPLNTGAVIQGSSTLQVKFVAGNPGQTYCARGLSAFPRGYWTKSYYAPLDQPTGAGFNTDYFLHNPHAAPLTVSWQSRTSSGSFSIPALSTVSFRANVAAGVPVDSGLYLSAPDVFWGVGLNDSTGATYEWGYSLLPSTFLYSEHYLGWAPGFGTGGGGTNWDDVGVFLTVAQDNTRVFVDYDNNGTADQTYTLDRLQTQFIYDPNDGDMSRAHIWGTGDFTLAYGENRDTAETSDPSLDLGYVAIPGTDFLSLVLDVDKSVTPQVVPTASGSTASFTLVASSAEYSLDAVTLVDTLPPSWQFVANSAVISRPDLSTVSGAGANPTITGAGTLANPYVLTWSAAQLDPSGMAPNQLITVTFTGQTTAALAAGTLSQNRIVASGTRTVAGITQTFSTTDFVYVASGDLQIAKTSNAPVPLYPGDQYTYTVAVSNPAGSGVTQTNVSLFDAIPPGATYVSGTSALRRSTAFVADFFGAAAYNNSDGRNAWTADWTETDASGGGATGGLLWITGGQLQFRDINYLDEFNTNGSYAGSDGAAAWSASPWTETDGYSPGPAGAGGGFAWVTNNELQFRNLAYLDQFNTNGSYAGSDGSIPWGTSWSESDVSGNTAGPTAGFVQVASNALQVGYQATNVADNFDSTSYARNDGNTNWLSASWTETGDNNNANTGTIQVDNAAPFAPGKVAFTRCGSAGCTSYITRAASVSGGSSVTISFVLTTAAPAAGGLENAELLEAAYDVGAGFQVMETIGANGVHAGACQSPCTITVPSGATTLTLRFRETTRWAVGNYAQVDSVNIAFNNSVGSASRRTADLTGSSGATLNFSYSSANLGPGDIVVVEASSTGAAGSFTTLATFTNGSPSAAPPYSLSPYISANTTVQFRVTGGIDGASKTFSIDDVEIRNNPVGTTVQRSASLTGASSATVNFTYSPANLGPGDTVVVEASNAAGGPFSVLATFTGGTPNVAPPYDLTSYISGATTIRFRVTAGIETASKIFSVDNVEIRNSPVGTAIRRSANPSGAGITAARLEFDYGSTNLASTDTVEVQASTAAAGPYTRLATFTGGIPDVAPPYNLTPYISTATTIRFLVTGGINGTYKTFNVDNVVIAYDVPLTAAAPPDLVSSSSAYDIRPGEALISTFDVTVDDPFPSGQTEITNTAATTTALFPVQITASKTDVVVNPESTAATVSGRLWLDADGDTVQDLGESGIDNVTVTLKDQFGAPVASTSTDSNGRFLFTGVSPETGYYVEATAPPAPGGLPLANLTQSFPAGHSDYQTTSFDLVAGQNYTNANQGYRPAAGTVSFGDVAWLDGNGNGIRDGGEPGLGGVTVRLYRDGGNNSLDPILDTLVPVPTLGPGTVSVTAGNATVTGVGTSFLTLAPGDPITIGATTYTINAIASATSLTLTSNATASASTVSYQVVSTPGPGTVAVTGGSPTVTGTGTSFLSLAPGDPIEIRGVKYEVSSVTSDTSLTLTTNVTGGNGTGLAYGIPTPIVTAADGSYAFTGITPAGQTYFVSARTPTGYTSTGPTNYMFTNVVGGTGYVTADFGFNVSSGSTYSIKDRVWRDANADGDFDSGTEAGIAGVTVDLLNASGQVVATVVTAADGTFTFSGLPGGGADYTTRITDTSGVLTSFYGTTAYATALQRSEPNLVGNVDHTVGSPATDGYGFNSTRSVGDTVFTDLDGDGTQDAGEPGMAGVVVRLHRDRNGNGLIDLVAGAGTVQVTNGSPAVVGTGTTFLNYRAGEPITIGGVGYVIASVTDNTNLTLTAAYAGATGSGVAYAGNPLGGGSVAVTNGSNVVTGTGTTFTSYSPGDPITISGVVYTVSAVASNTSLTLSTNYAGATASGITNYSGPPVFAAAVTTDAGGQYLFAGLPNASYVVSVQAPSGYTYVAGTRPDTDANLAGVQLVSTISGAGNDLTRDFAFQATASRTVSGRVWSDADGNGSIGGSETGISGVTLDVLDTNDIVVRTVTTDSSGNYSVTGLAAGSYTVRVTDTTGTLNGYDATWEYGGGPLDGDAPVNLGSGDVSGVNFGFRQPTPTYASVSYLEATTSGGAVVVEWQTTQEVGTVGWDLLRLDEKSGEFVPVNESLLPALCGHPEGGTYSFEDAGAPLAPPLTYLLVEVDAWGSRHEYGPYVIPALGSGGISSAPYKRSANAIPRSEKARLAASGREREAAFVALSSRKGTRVKATTRDAGLHFIDTATLAGLLGEKPNSLASRVETGRVVLRNLGADVPYAPAAGGAGLYFYAERIESPYTNENVYWVAAQKGPMMASTAGPPTGGAPAATFVETTHVEVDVHPHPALFQDPEADFYGWDELYPGYPGYDTATHGANLRGVAGTGQPTLTVYLHGGAETPAAVDHHVRISWNGAVVGETSWDGLVPHAVSIPLGPSDVVEGANTLVVTALLDPGVPYGIVFLDSFDVRYPRLYRAAGDELAFTLPPGTDAAVSGFSSPGAVLLDVTEPENPLLVAGATAFAPGDGSYGLRFANRSATTRSYLAALPAGAKRPFPLIANEPSGLAATTNGADYLLIAPSSLVPAAESLAAYRRTKGLDTMVVDLEDVQNDFGFGLATPVAIQELLAFATDEWARAPEYVTLVGRGTFDYKNVQGVGDNVMPTLLAGTPYGLAASDVSFAPLSTAAGRGLTAIGRLPVLTAQEVLDYVAKVQAHESGPAGAWQQELLLTADDPDAGGAFNADSDAVGGVAPVTFLKTKVYLPAFTAPAARIEIVNQVNAGALLFNYIGHGGPGQLATENIFSKSDVPSLSNAGRLPVFLAMTCSSGNYAIPGFPSLGESLVLWKSGGAYVTWAPSGLSLNDGAVAMNEAFFRSAFVDGEKVVGRSCTKALESLPASGPTAYMKAIYNILGEPVVRLP